MTLLRCVVLIGAFLLSGCNTDVSVEETPTTTDNARGGAAGANVTVGPTAALPMVIPDPPRNPTSMEKVALGRLLFFDPVLSGNRDLSCASCHDPAFAYADGKRVSLGAGNVPVSRNSPTVLDTAFNGLTLTNAHPDPAQAPMFWDSRARSLEDQARAPVKALDEMRGAAFDEAQIFPEVSRRLAAIPSYVTAFEAAFGPDSISKDTIVEAIAAFERTLVTTNSSYDRFSRGETTALSAAAQRGLATFRRNGCDHCHSGPMFSDYQLHRLGVPGSADVGAGNGAFRTPSLRNVSRTAPYMHNGSLPNLDAVFQFYRRVDDRLDPALRGVNGPGRDDADDVRAFLDALSDGTFDRSAPTTVPSGLRVGP
jgi:cytochrome c peroxidase